MATIERVPATQLRAGDSCPDGDGNPAFTILEIRPATNAEIRLFAKADGMRPGDLVANIRWLDGGLDSRFWHPTDATSVIR